MKNIVRFLSYCWSSWEPWQKLILVSVALNIVSVVLPDPWRNWASVAAVSIVAGMVITWWVTGMLLPKWREFKAKQNELLTTIKNSEKQSVNN